MEQTNRDRAMAERIAREAEKLGGRVYYVGGCVRDALLGIESKDIDVEVHGLTPAQTEEILDRLGTRLAFGKSFGIYGLAECGLDIAMPRKETATGRGHRDFSVSVDPHIGPEKAAERRDFTINAMMQNVLTGQILDPFGGRRDLTNGVIRHVNAKAFPEDPLRVLRAARFAARFGFTVTEETQDLCRGIDLAPLSGERVMGELQAVLLHTERPSVFFRILRDMDQLDVWFPELKALIGVPQERRYHREGDVWTHTLMVADEAAARIGSTENDLALMLSALTHDMGKAVCTESAEGRIRAVGHEKESVALAERFLRRLTNERQLIRIVLELTELHMRPNAAAAEHASIKATNRMFDRTQTPEALLALAAADDRGRITERPQAENEKTLRQRLATYRETMARPYVTGEDLLRAGLEPGPEFSDWLAYAHKLRLAGIGKEDALKQTLGYAGKNQKQ